MAVLTLAFGIGASTSIFSVVNSVLLKPLSYKDPEQLVMVHERIPELVKERIPLPAPDVVQINREARTLDGVAGFLTDRRDLLGAGEGARIRVSRVTANLFPLLCIGRNSAVRSRAPRTLRSRDWRC